MHQLVGPGSRYWKSEVILYISDYPVGHERGLSLEEESFESKVVVDLTTAKNSILSAEQVEPRGSKYTYYDATCTFQGYVNYNF